MNITPMEYHRRTLFLDRNAKLITSPLLKPGLQFGAPRRARFCRRIGERVRIVATLKRRYLQRTTSCEYGKPGPPAHGCYRSRYVPSSLRIRLGGLLFKSNCFIATDVNSLRGNLS